mgnify:CR=1 FL=1
MHGRHPSLSAFNLRSDFTDSCIREKKQKKVFLADTWSDQLHMGGGLLELCALTAERSLQDDSLASFFAAEGAAKYHFSKSRWDWYGAS